MNDILEFQGEYRWLSNFWPAKVVLDGVEYPTVENAYQAAKTPPTNRAGFVNCKPGEAKRLGRFVKIRDDWEDVKVDVMRGLIEQKFAAGTLLGSKLMSTGQVDIVEGNHWGDTFWGVYKGEGKNILGTLLQEQRKKLGNPNG